MMHRMLTDLMPSLTARVSRTSDVDMAMLTMLLITILPCRVLKAGITQ